MSSFREMFYGGNEPKWIIGTSGAQSPVAFDQHPQYYYSCGCPGNSYNVPAEVLAGTTGTENHEYMEVVELSRCAKCLYIIRSKLGAVEGVTSVYVNRETLKVTVAGKVKMHVVLETAQTVKSNAAIWQD